MTASGPNLHLVDTVSGQPFEGSVEPRRRPFWSTSDLGNHVCDVR